MYVTQLLEALHCNAETWFYILSVRFHFYCLNSMTQWFYKSVISKSNFKERHLIAIHILRAFSYSFDIC